MCEWEDALDAEFDSWLDEVVGYDDIIPPEEDDEDDEPISQ